MNDDVEFESGTETAPRVGDRLRAAREARSLDLKEIAKETRIPMRHLETLEQSDFAALPGKTYAIGFAKAYARAVDLDEVAIAEEVRREYDYIDTGASPQYQAFQPADPSRVPSRFLAWTAAIVAVVLAVAYGVWRLDYFGGDVIEPTPVASTAAADRPDPAPAARAANVAANAPVVLTATERVWFRIDDADGNRLHEVEMAPGDSYTVDAAPVGQTLRTARPQALAITVGGQPIASLGPPDTLVSNVPLAPQALVARANAGP
ncbi:MAG: helix-turn-helix domain-containing protein [Sphingomonadales bacterium]|nr:helix-turn-helix domain-containing protein [Sphingomonadales bacterium]